MPGGRFDGRVLDLAEAFGLLDARLDFADAGQVLVELVLVAGVEPALHGARVFEDEIEDRPLLAPGGACRFASALARRPSPNSRSKTSRGLASGVMGVVGELQEMLYW